ncbi:unnamed protein product, partial [Heterosigma akashiwo]
MAVGFGHGGKIACFSYLPEAIPSRQRGLVCMLASTTWGIGSILIASTAWIFLSMYGWRFLMVVTSSLALVSLFLILTLPESPRWLLSKGWNVKAANALKLLALKNGVTLDEALELKDHLPIDINSDPIQDNNIKHSQTAAKAFMTLLSKPLWWTTALFSFMAMSCGACYIGLISLIARIFEESIGGLPACTFRYSDILISASAESSFTFFSSFWIEHGRRWTQFVCFGLYSAPVIMLGFTDSSHPDLLLRLVLFSFSARGCISAACNANWIASQEQYPTNVRA